MLEFKNVSVVLSTGQSSKAFSLMLQRGEVACLCGPRGGGKTRLLQAIMGLAPVASGYITVDGEPVTLGSAAYFRHMISYVPQQLPDVAIGVGELCQMVLDLEAHHDKRLNKEALLAAWRAADINEELYGRMANEVDSEQLQLAMLSLLPLLGRPIVLIDNMPQTHEAYNVLRAVADGGAEIVYTCEDNAVPCDKIINM